MEWSRAAGGKGWGQILEGEGPGKKDRNVETECLEIFMMCKLFTLLFIKPSGK